MRPSPFLLICSAGFFALFSSTISKSPVLPLFAAHLGASPSEVGLVASVSAFTGIVASVPAGLLSDRFGRERVLALSLLIFATAPFFYLFVTSLLGLALVRFCHGFATALFVPVTMAYVADLFSKERGERLGWFSTSTLAGRFLAPLIGGLIIGLSLSATQDMNYRVIYIVCGISGTLALLVFLGIKGTKPTCASRSNRWSETWSAFRLVASNRFIIITCLVEAAILFAYGTFETFMPLYCMKKGISAYEVGILLSSQVIAIALTKPAMGRLSDRHGRHPQIFIGAMIGTGCISAFGYFDAFIPLLLLSIAFGLSLSIVTSATSALISDLSDSVAPSSGRGSAMGMLGSIMDIGHTTGPIAAGYVAALFNYEWAFIGAGIVLALAGALFRWAGSP